MARISKTIPTIQNTAAKIEAYTPVTFRYSASIARGPYITNAYIAHTALNGQTTHYPPFIRHISLGLVKLAFELRLVQMVVNTASIQQFVMCAALDDSAAVHN